MVTQWDTGNRTSLLPTFSWGKLLRIFDSCNFSCVFVAASVSVLGNTGLPRIFCTSRNTFLEIVATLWQFHSWFCRMLREGVTDGYVYSSRSSSCSAISDNSSDDTSSSPGITAGRQIFGRGRSGRLMALFCLAMRRSTDLFVHVRMSVCGGGGMGLYVCVGGDLCVCVYVCMEITHPNENQA